MAQVVETKEYRDVTKRRSRSKNPKQCDDRSHSGNVKPCYETQTSTSRAQVTDVLAQGDAELKEWHKQEQ
jgi:hypothetical protein